MRNGDRVCACSVGHERRAHHAAVRGGEVNRLARVEIPVLVGHFSADGQRFVGRDGRRERRHDEVNGCTGSDRDVLGAAHQAETRRDGRGAGRGRRKQAVAANASCGRRPGHGRRLHHGLVIVGDGVEVHRRVGVRGRCTRRADGHAGDVRGVEQDRRSENGVAGRTRIERSVGVAGVGGCDDHPRLFAGDGHARCADIEPNPARGVNVDNGG